MTTVPGGADAPPCDVCEALTVQRDAARAAGRTGEAGDCERELREHEGHGRGRTS
ncbi:hypothetical protein PV396_38265 [Streptomyces sp. ME02-8801-2C]|uniref:hypothetical protein n=1 Tax=Streptomyces sp. ME02-8801-2C TaxID=3028680 RepID=UPI0029A75F7F|nr:hypothetical protein [Streptomyces sp. ME02-8801-2C]MDX3457732.1 hypothetical protein [Streptomyces sp. ME02-8801-2C]